MDIISQQEADKPWPYTSLHVVTKLMFKDKLPYHELVHLAMEAQKNCDFQVSGLNEQSNDPAVRTGTKADLLKALRSAFPPENNYINASEPGWAYIEAATRLRVLWSVLFACAFWETTGPGSKRATGSQTNAKEDIEKIKRSTWLEKFFSYLTFESSSWTKSLFSEGTPKLLLNNQKSINTSIHKKSTPGNFRVEKPTINWPKSPDMFKSTAENPIGPLSLECAFVFALQLAGIDLAAWCEERLKAFENQVLVEEAILPRIFTCASFSMGQACEQRWYNSDIRCISNQELHTTVRTLRKLETNTAGTGVSIGIDLEDNLGLDSLDGSKRYFGFALHAVDCATHDVTKKPAFKDGKKRVWPHCHQGFWSSTSSFQQMFSVHDGSARFNENENQMPQYIQNPSTHIYLSRNPLKDLTKPKVPAKSKV